MRTAILVLAMGSLAVAAACGACKHGRHDKGRQGEARQPTIVTGRFVLAHGASHTSPDGDTVRFLPDREAPFCSRRPCPHGVNVRVASVDALELHYECGHQDLELATRARDRLLELLGFTSVEYRHTRNGTPEVVRSVPAELRGYLVATGPDTTGKRVVGYLYPGEPPLGDGSPVALSDAILRRSVNWLLLSEGLVYPAYFADSVNAGTLTSLDDAVEAPRMRGSGVWSAPAPEPSDAMNRIWPPIARSYCAWSRDGHESSPEAYVQWLRGAGADARYPYVQRSTGRRVWLKDIVMVESGRLVLRVPPEDLVAQP